MESSFISHAPITAGLICVVLTVLVTWGAQYLKKLHHVQQSNSKLWEALQDEQVDQAKSILSSLPPDLPLDSSRRGQKMIHCAVTLADIELLEKMLQLPAGNKIDVNSTLDACGNGALHLAALQGRQDVVKTLLLYGAEVDIRNNEGWTPLHFAAMKGRHQVKRVLLDAGADVSAITRSGTSVFELQEREKVHFGSARPWPGTINPENVDTQSPGQESPEESPSEETNQDQVESLDDK